MSHVKKEISYIQHISRLLAVPVWFYLLLYILLVAAAGSLFAATEAGTIIKNQASASYRDTQGVRRVTTSNVVETVIRQVAAVELTISQTKPGIAGHEVNFSHTLVNTGNGDDQFEVEVQSSGSDFDLENLVFYSDSDRDGQADSFVPVTRTPLLRSGESWNFIVAGLVPFDVLDGESGSIVVNVASAFNNAVADANTDAVVVTELAVIEVSKQISELQSVSPGGPFTVQIHYSNPSVVAAANVVLIDALPPGMSYVPGSGRWSASGATVLSDSNPLDVQSGVRYCAYDSSCTGLPEANTDNDNDSVNQVTAIVETVAAGESGFIEFEVAVAANLASATLFNTAELLYTTAGAQQVRINSNVVPFTVVAGAGVVINGSLGSNADGVDEPLEKTESVFGADSNLPVCTSPNLDPDGDGFGVENSQSCIVLDLQAGSSVFYANTVWNTGSDIDAFDITTVNSTFPANTVFRLLAADGQTPLLDTNGNGVPDTGPVFPGASYQIVLQVLLPAGVSGNNNGVPFGITTVATSIMDALVSNTMLNLLHNITAASVDITNVAELGDAAALGLGAGPEPVAVTTLQSVPGGTVDFDLVVNNTADFPVQYNLAATIISDFSSIDLPDQWRVDFLLQDGSVVSNTGLISAGDFVNITARVSLPEQATASVTSLYFQASNDFYAVQDIKHDAVEISAVQSLLLGIDQEGQAQPGGSRVYPHTLVNTGNTDVNNISLTVSDSRAGQGFSSVLYEDTDGNGVFGAADQLINSVSLAAAESKVLFVRVFVPATASGGSSNLTELVVSSATETLSVTDVTNVSSGNITVLKEQALDNQCDGVLDSSYSSNTFSVEPGNNCVRYRLIATNVSSESVINVVVADATPTFTSYTDNAFCSRSDCKVTEPVGGGEGDITASIPVLPAGDSVVVEFMVRID